MPPPYILHSAGLQRAKIEQLILKFCPTSANHHGQVTEQIMVPVKYPPVTYVTNVTVPIPASTERLHAGLLVLLQHSSQPMLDTANFIFGAQRKEQLL